MATTPPEGIDEAERIRVAYAKRENRGRYSFFNQAYLLALQEVERTMLSLLGSALDRAGSRDLAAARALDVGCGGGYWLRRMIDWGLAPANLCGLDIQPERVDRARASLPGSCDLRAGDARALPWSDGHFAIVSQFVMFSSVLDPDVRSAIAREMMRVKAPGGCILWYDFLVDNPRNPDVKGMGRGEIARLFPGCSIELRRVNLAPPLARVLLPRYRALYHMAAALPWARTHWVGVMR